MEENNKQAQENLIPETPCQPETTGTQTPIIKTPKKILPIIILLLVIIALIAIGGGSHLTGEIALHLKILVILSTS